MALHLYDTLRARRRVHSFGRHVRMYVCGITSYAPTHRPCARVRRSTSWPLARAALCGAFVRNYTDIDDKIIRAANEVGEDPNALSERYIEQFQADMRDLGCREPDVEPRVTRHIPEIIATIGRIERAGCAYAVDGDVYFEVSKYPAYGRLSGRSLEDLEAGARVDVDPRKRSPYDFALWKSAKRGEPSWDSPWGPGRPGWHIECSAMSEKYLGPVFDIHGGGKDLMFPHHENEIAQSCVANRTSELARVWMHNGFLIFCRHAPGGKEVRADATLGAGRAGDACAYVYRDEDLKMSKSRGNFYPVREITRRYEGEALRLSFLGSHYRKPIQFSHALLDDAERRLDKHYKTLDAIDGFTSDQTFAPGKSFEAIFGIDSKRRIEEAMDDDLNTAVAIAEVSELFRIANELIFGKEKERVGKVLSPADTSRLLLEIREQIRDSGSFLGLWQHEPKAYLARRRLVKAAHASLRPAEIEAKIAERVEARARRDFARGDAIRDELRAAGIVLRDSKDGTSWDFDE